MQAQSMTKARRELQIDDVMHALGLRECFLSAVPIASERLSVFVNHA